MLHDKIHIHDWVNFDHTVTRKKMEIGDLKSYTHDLINKLSNRSNNAKINEGPLKIVCSSLVKMISDCELEEFSWFRHDRNCKFSINYRKVFFM